MKKNKTNKLQFNPETLRQLEEIKDLSGVQGGMDVVVTQKTAAVAEAGGSWLLCCTGK